DGYQHIVGHGAEGALDHQVEYAIVLKGLPGIVEGNVAEHDAEPHQREGGGEPHHDHDHDEGKHQQPECGVAHVCRSPPMPRWRALSSISWARAMAILRDSSSTYSLCASCSSTTSISATSLRRLGHLPVTRHAAERTISATPC